MAFTSRVQRRFCTALMVFVQRRGSSEGLWVCPVRAASRRIVRVEEEETEERGGSNHFSKASCSVSETTHPDGGGQSYDSAS